MWIKAIMNKKNILNFRKVYETIFLKIRRFHMRRLVIKMKKNQSNKNVLTRKMKKEIRAFWRPYKRISFIFHNFYTEKNGVFF